MSNAIPTTYRGVRMRSRLEARWAAFFDAIDWPWQYEPFDLSGYIPDFVLPFAAGSLLIEVKPAHSLADLHAHTPKIDATDWDKEALVVGVDLFPSSAFGDNPSVGVIREADGPEWFWDEAPLAKCISCGHVFPFHGSASWRCRVCGADDGNAHMGSAPTDLRDRWVAAGNRVQWRAA